MWMRLCIQNRAAVALKTTTTYCASRNVVCDCFFFFWYVLSAIHKPTWMEVGEHPFVWPVPPCCVSQVNRLCVAHNNSCCGTENKRQNHLAFWVWIEGGRGSGVHCWVCVFVHGVRILGYVQTDTNAHQLEQTILDTTRTGYKCISKDWFCRDTHFVSLFLCSTHCTKRGGGNNPSLTNLWPA